LSAVIGHRLFVITHKDVPVTQGLKATLSSADNSYQLAIDTNGDGQVDQMWPPGTLEQLAPVMAQIYLPFVGKP